MKENIYVDALVILEGENPSFFSYLSYDDAISIQENGGLEFAEKINLKEVEERKIPDSVKQGEAHIVDVLVKLEPNTVHSLS